MSALEVYSPAALAVAEDPVGAISFALEQGRAWLAEAKQVEQVKELAARAEAIRVYARQADLGRQAEDDACELRLRAERRMGQLLAEQEKAPAGRPAKEIGSAREPISRPPTYAELGIDKKQAHHAQQLAKAADEVFDRAVDLAKTAAGATGVSRASIMRGVVAQIGDQVEKADERAKLQAELREQEEWAASTRPPDFDAAQNAKDVGERGALLGLRRSFQRLPEPEALVAHHGRRLRESHIAAVRFAEDWCRRFLAAVENRETT